jgi:hypothetical protein
VGDNNDGRSSQLLTTHPKIRAGRYFRAVLGFGLGFGSHDEAEPGVRTTLVSFNPSEDEADGQYSRIGATENNTEFRSKPKNKDGGFNRRKTEFWLI